MKLSMMSATTTSNRYLIPMNKNTNIGIKQTGTFSVYYAAKSARANMELAHKAECISYIK